MYFMRDEWERRFQLSFNRGCLRTDILYALCLAAFALSAIYRLQQTPIVTGTVLAIAPLLSCGPLLLLLTTRWPALYLRHRQPVVTALKVWTAHVGSLLSDQYVASVAEGCGSCVEGGPADVARAGLGLTAQLALHALGLQTTGAWLVFSQGFVVAASARTATLCCTCYLGPATRRLLASRPVTTLLRQHPWAGDLVGSTDPELLCQAYALGLQIMVGYGATVLLGLLAEWRQRLAFAAKHQLPPPSRMDMLALNGAFLSMLFLLGRVALAEAVRKPLACSGRTAGGAAGAEACIAEL